MIRVGCQGWRYPDWRKHTPEQTELDGPFYLSQTPPEQELALYSRTFDLVEVDATFYAIPPVHVIQSWHDQTPPDFCFTLKLPRLLTHEYRLRRGRGTLSEFCQRAELLGPKLGAILIQMPPSFGLDEWDALERFLPYLPQQLPFAIEFRDPRWFRPQTWALLAQSNVVPVLGATPWIGTDLSFAQTEYLPDWFYVRIMGVKEGGLSVFTHLQVERGAELKRWADWLHTRSQRMYVLVDNHYQGFSPGTVTLLKQFLNQSIQPFPRDQSASQLTLPL